MLRAIGPRRRHPSEKAAGPKASKVYRRYRPKAYGGLAALGEAPVACRAGESGRLGPQSLAGLLGEWSDS